MYIYVHLYLKSLRVVGIKLQPSWWKTWWNPNSRFLVNQIFPVNQWSPFNQYDSKIILLCFHPDMHKLCLVFYRIPSWSVLNISAQEAPLVWNRKEVPFHGLQKPSSIDTRGHNCGLFSWNKRKSRTWKQKYLFAFIFCYNSL